MNIDFEQVFEDLAERRLRNRAASDCPEDFRQDQIEIKMLLLETVKACINIDVETNSFHLRNELMTQIDQCCEDSLFGSGRELGYVEPSRIDLRYEALLAADSSDLLLKRVGQTVAFLRLSVCNNSPTTLEKVYARAGERALEYARRVYSVHIGDAGCPPANVKMKTRGGEESKFEDFVSNELYEGVSVPFISSVDDEDGSLIRALEERETLRAEVKRAHDAFDAACEDLEHRRYSDALSVVGKMPEACELPGAPAVSCEREVPCEKLKELLHEVERSFEVYRQCVEDFGLLGAMGTYAGAHDCRGESWGDTNGWGDGYALEVSFDGVLPKNRNKVASIGYFSEIFEKPGDAANGIDLVIERMRMLNAARYEGIFDKDPSLHIDAFWYGLSKLGEFADGAVKADEDAWDEFCTALKKAMWASLAPLAARMNEKQVKDYAEALREVMAK